MPEHFVDDFGPTRERNRGGSVHGREREIAPAGADEGERLHAADSNGDHFSAAGFFHRVAAVEDHFDGVFE